MKGALLVLAALAVAGCMRDAPPAASPEPLPTPATPSGAAQTGAPVRLEPWMDGFEAPLLLTHDGRPDEVYVVEQGGRVWQVEHGRRTLWIDISRDVVAGGEQGLLGLAFEPEGERAYLSYTDTRGDSVLERVGADMSREVLLRVDQPYPNHNGGHLAFGPDGLLYYGLGDGGSGGDPQGNGQDPAALLGSLLRLDVAQARPEPEIFAKGLRNPWRFTFDRGTGDLWIGDVGQNKVEEIDFLRAGTKPGTNFGWNVFEGTQRYSLVGQPFSPPTMPVAEYSHDDGCSVTGGYVYRGSEQTALAGVYFLADYCSGKLWGLRHQESGWHLVELLDTEINVSSFGEDALGELYVVDHGGAVLRLVHGGGALPAPLQ